ncbi:crotonase/enoyl-CoA hydratase family protein [Branchiibius cervicis]|uniref:Crotonase/enoyl-CoA hydratase family protein n=1 Tax=Branchiibius cervicis TaxID=908252 RepID=A0ABW2AX27_9MICO
MSADRPAEELVTCDIADQIARVHLNRPEKLNALTFPLLAQLVQVAHRIRADRSVRAVVLAGAGDSFCAGLDFASVAKDPKKLFLGFVPNPIRGTNRFQEACWAWRRLPVPVIAAVEGHCYGGGIQIALAADFRITHPEAKWSVLEGKWGLVPDMTGVRTLSELVGVETAKRLTMTAEVITGARAHELGLAGQLSLSPYDDALALAHQLTERSPDALAAAKRLFDRAGGASARRIFAAERREQLPLLLGRNHRAARTAGLNRQTPTYADRARR